MSDHFDSRVAMWNEYMQTPWGRLQNSTRMYNLRRHLSEHFTKRKLDILDIGGGNGVETLPLTLDGHRLTVLDSSPKMLADGRQQSAEFNPANQITTIEGSVLDLTKLVTTNSYDLLIFHNVVQYLAEADVPAVFASFHRVLRAGGMLSIGSVNRYAQPLRFAIHHNFEQALAHVDTKHVYAKAFDHTVRVYAAEEISDLLANAGFTQIAHCGVRVFLDYIKDNTPKFDPEKYAQIELLERQLSGRFPYKHTAHSFQLIMGSN